MNVDKIQVRSRNDFTFSNGLNTVILLNGKEIEAVTEFHYHVKAGSHVGVVTIKLHAHVEIDANIKRLSLEVE